MVDIYKELDNLRKQGKDAVIVTVTEKSGMGPADVGKKMLVTEGNIAFGTVGGGAIEYYAREKCKEVLEQRTSFSEKYVLNDRTVSVDDGSIILPMACGGRVTLFYEFVGPKQYVYIFGAGHCGAALARVLKENLNAVRVDTSKSLIDHYFDDKDTSGFDPHGVCKELIFALREALDKEGFNYVKIVVSSSFGPEKIKEWKALKVPVDMFGVGTYFVNNMTCGFTGDLVMLDGKPEAKEGRSNYPSSRLEKVIYGENEND